MLMSKQIIFIHGGDAYNSYEEYLHELKSMKTEKDYFLPSKEDGWKYTLSKKLGKGYEVFIPEMPSWMNAKYIEWNIWFDKLLKYVDEGPVFVGHSLGAIFLARYFAENPDSKKARAVILVAPPYRDPSSKDPIADFFLPANTDKLDALGSKLHVYFSEDDPIVSFTNFGRYKKLVPAATFRTFKKYGHFRLKEFPEIIGDIKAVFKSRK